MLFVEFDSEFDTMLLMADASVEAVMRFFTWRDVLRRALISSTRERGVRRMLDELIFICNYFIAGDISSIIGVWELVWSCGLIYG